MKHLDYPVMAVDMDGTLLNSAKEVTPRQSAALARYRALGGKIIIATARSPRFSGVRAPAGFAYDGRVLCSGSLIYDGEALIEETLIPPATVEDVYRALRERGCRRFCYTSREGITHADFDSRTLWPYTPFIDMREDPAPCPALKLLIPLDSVVTAALVAAHCPPSLRLTVIDAGTLAQITPAQADKWRGIEILLRRWGFAAQDVLAFGDDRSDLSMLTAAGRGVAMGNGIPAVLEAADDRTSSNDQDGIAVYLEKLGI